MKKSRAWRECPICGDLVYVDDLKKVMIQKFQQNITDIKQLKLRLMERDVSTSSFFTLPKNITRAFQAVNQEEFALEMPWNFYPEALRFSRIIKVSNTYLLEQLGADLDSLRVSLQEANQWEPEYGETQMFIEMATSLVLVIPFI